jgi:hypothetical protein
VQRVRNEEDTSGFTRDEYDIYKCWLRRFSDREKFESHKYQLMYDELELYNEIVRTVGNETRWLEKFQWFDDVTYERLVSPPPCYAVSCPAVLPLAPT